jgi:hypothetical protein
MRASRASPRSRRSRIGWRLVKWYGRDDFLSAPAIQVLDTSIPVQDALLFMELLAAM